MRLASLKGIEAIAPPPSLPPPSAPSSSSLADISDKSPKPRPSPSSSPSPSPQRSFDMIYESATLNYQQQLAVIVLHALNQSPIPPPLTVFSLPYALIRGSASVIQSLCSYIQQRRTYTVAPISSPPPPRTTLSSACPSLCRSAHQFWARAPPLDVLILIHLGLTLTLTLTRGWKSIPGTARTRTTASNPPLGTQR